MAVRLNRDMVKITHEFQLETIPDHIVEAARKIIAAQALGPEDCRLLLDMIGMNPSTAEPPPTCLRCGRDYTRNRTGRASCFCSKRCYLETLRDERTARRQASMGSSHSSVKVKRHGPAETGPLSAA